ncbi:MAG: BLUF domain-containing protein [Acidobacteriaceae bacterium]|nr:BLUF domain-containing protein [Acidobacteriaceae bacterium]
MSEATERESNLISLVYVSSGTRHFERQEILDILQVSRKNNARLRITGILLYQDGNFMQVLEGAEQNLSELMCSIERDHRHRGVIVLLKKAISERLFPQWSMAFKDLSELPHEDAAAFSPFLRESVIDEQFRSRSEACYKLLLRFKTSLQR